MSEYPSKGRDSGLIGGYSGRRFEAGPGTYTDAEFMRKIVDATGLRGRTGAVVVDAMSGPGKVGQGIREQAPGNMFAYLDLSVPQLRKVPQEEGNGRIVADVRQIPLAHNSADVVVVRYGIKDLPADQQATTLAEMYRILRPGGTLVIADMVSPGEEEVPGAKEWLNNHHGLKQQLGGRDPETEGVCHIPTQAEWLRLLTGAGFEAEVSDDYVSQVDTTKWVAGKQITDIQREDMDRDILSTPTRKIKDTFNIRQEDGLVKIDYPVVILKATKPVENEITSENEAVSPRATAIVKRYLKEFGSVDSKFYGSLLAESSPESTLIEDSLAEATAKTVNGILRTGITPSLPEIAKRVVANLDTDAAQEEINSWSEDGELSSDPSRITKDAIVTGSTLTPHYASLPGLIAMVPQAEAIESELGLSEGDAFADEKHFGELVRRTYRSAEEFMTTELDRIDQLSGRRFRGLAADMKTDWKDEDTDEGLRTLREMIMPHVLLKIPGVARLRAKVGGRQVLRERCVEDTYRFWGYDAVESLPINIRERVGLR